MAIIVGKNDGVKMESPKQDTEEVKSVADAAESETSVTEKQVKPKYIDENTHSAVKEKLSRRGRKGKRV